MVAKNIPVDFPDDIGWSGGVLGPPEWPAVPLCEKVRQQVLILLTMFAAEWAFFEPVRAVACRINFLHVPLLNFENLQNF